MFTEFVANFPPNIPTKCPAMADTKELDVDQIENLVAMSLSNAYDVVSSWIQPSDSSKAAADAKLAADNAEFERMAFRPPRYVAGIPET